MVILLGLGACEQAEHGRRSDGGGVTLATINFIRLSTVNRLDQRRLLVAQ